MQSGRDADGNFFIDSDPEVFRHVLNFLSYDRKWLPSSESGDLRNLVEIEIKRWNLEMGMVRPLEDIKGSQEDVQPILADVDG